MSMDILLNLENVTLAYFNFPKSFKELLSSIVLRKNIYTYKSVLDNISFTLKKGEIICLCGSNGSGKSTLLYAISGKLKPLQGRINVNGKINAFLEPVSINPNETAFNLLCYMAAAYNLNPSIIKEKLSKLTSASGIPLNILKNAPIYTLSKGMLGRLRSSFYLLFSSDIALYDEIFAGGDQYFIDNWLNLFSKQIKHNNASIFASHSFQVWEKLSKLNARFIVLGNYSIAYDGKDLDLAKHIYFQTTKYRCM